MRKECKGNKSVTMARVQGYHEGGGYGEGYAFAGFRGNWYLNSDRKIRLDDNFRRADGQELQGYGLEVETECSSISRTDVLAEVYDKIIFPNFKFGDVMFKMQRDGSLGGRSSAEIITQVMTKSRIRNDYQAWKLMYNTYFPAFGISADSFRTSCGMHVNVSNACFGKTEAAREEAIRKLYYIINKHYDVFVRAFYRNPARTHWCGQMDYSVARTMDLHNMPSSHCNCFNGSHYDAGRIEIRLVGGQKSFGCFRNTMETVFHVVERVQRLKWSECDDLYAIFQGCNQYVFDRLESMCGLSDTVLDSIRVTVKREELL